MSNRLSSSYKSLLVLVIGLLLLGAYVAKAQTNANNTNSNTNPGNVNTAVNNNTNVNANTNNNTNGNQNGNTNDSKGGANQSAGTTTETKGTVASLFDSYWYKVVVAFLFGFVLLGFAYTIMRAIRFSKFTFNNPLGLPDGSLRAVLAFLLVSFLGFYVFASVMTGTEFKPPDALLGIVATVIGFYFGSRSSEGAAAASATSGRTGSVDGTVVDSADSPAAGATIELSQTSTTKKLTQTSDLNGKFKFDNVPIGDYDIQASKTGQNPSTAAKVKVTAGGTQTVNLKLKP